MTLLIYGPDGVFRTRLEPELLVGKLREAAATGAYDGRPSAFAQAYLDRCRVFHVPTGTLIIFTRDQGHHTSGWFKNPDYERCEHLSLSRRDPETGEPAPLPEADANAWARYFFGDARRWCWIERAATERGKQLGVVHWRLFCDEAWAPIKPRGEVYSTELTERGWKSASELGVAIESPLVPG